MESKSGNTKNQVQSNCFFWNSFPDQKSAGNNDGDPKTDSEDVIDGNAKPYPEKDDGLEKAEEQKFIYRQDSLKKYKRMMSKETWKEG